MAERIGNVLYWLGCLIAVLFAILAGFTYYYSNPEEAPLFTGASLVCALISWLVGRAFRYILAGR